MNELEQARLIINEVDKEMIELFKKRMKAAKMVAHYKMENSLPILDSKREEALKSRNIEILADGELEEYYLTFIEGMLKASKDYQKHLVESEK